jgi:large subunit ribosomal protein L17
MRHKRNKFRLSKPTDQRLALLRGLAVELLSREKIITTYKRALAAKRFAENIICLARKADLASKRKIIGMLANDNRIKSVLNSLAERCAGKDSGWIRVTKINNRGGDNAPQALLELI